MKTPKNTRQVARRAVQDQIALVAIRRFKDHGFDKTTIDDIAADMGMSTRNYFRYFPSKEDVLLGPDMAFRTTYLVEFEKVLPVADLWDALRIAIENAITICSAVESRQVASDRQSLIRSTPALLARQLEMTERLQREVTDMCLAQKRPEDAMPPLTASAIVRSAFACWSAVLRQGEAVIDAEGTITALQNVMGDLRPKIVTHREDT